MNIYIHNSYFFGNLNNKFLINILFTSFGNFDLLRNSLFHKVHAIQFSRKDFKKFKYIEKNNVNLLHSKFNNFVINDFLTKNHLNKIINSNKTNDTNIFLSNKIKIPSIYQLDNYEKSVALPVGLRTEEYILNNQKRFLDTSELNRLRLINDNKIFLAYDTYFLSFPQQADEYNVFFSRSRMNLFLTLTNVRGEVIISRSTGWCGIRSKKKKKSSDAFKSVCEKFAKDCTFRNIKVISRFFTKFGPLSAIRSILSIFTNQNLQVQKFMLIRAKPHSFDQKMRKLRRI